MVDFRNEVDDLRSILEQAKEVSLEFRQGLDHQRVKALRDELADGPKLANHGMGTIKALEMFQKDILPSLSASPGPRYFGYVTGGSTPASLAGDWLCSATDQNLSCPGDSAASALTQKTIHLLLDLFELPLDAFDGSFTTGATASNLLALLTAIQVMGEKYEINVCDVGLKALPEIRVFSACPHASMIKMLQVTGLGRSSWEYVPQIAQTERMDLALLDTQLALSKAPCKIVVASAATVTASSFDDLNKVADICEKYDAFLHVDAAFGIFSRCVPDLKHLTEGLERADSITGDAHKWLNVPYDGGFFFTRHISMLENALRVSAPYLKTHSAVPTFMNRTIENSQRFRALPIWMNLMAYGRQGIIQAVQQNCRLAEKLRSILGAKNNMEILCNDAPLHTVTFRGVFQGHEDEQNRMNGEFLRRINDSGKVFATPGAFNGRIGIRMALSNWLTREEDVEITVDAIDHAFQSTAKS